MHVKNHMAMWILWILWILHVRYYGNPLYKPLCAFLVFVDLVWIMCGRLCGFWSCVVGFAVFGSVVLRVHLPAGLCGSVVLPSMVLPSMPMPTVARRYCASTCSFWTAKKICPLLHFVLCSVSSPLGATFTNGENDHG